MRAILLPSLIVVSACSATPAVSPDSAPIERIGELGLVGPAVSGGEVNAFVYLPVETGVLCQERTVIGDCVVREVCNPGTTPAFSAGEIRFATSPETVVPAGQQGAQSAGGLQPAQQIRVSASGGDVPAFESTVDAPSRVVVTSRFDAAPVPGSQDLPLSWSGAQSGFVRLRSYAGTDGDFSFLDCQFEAAPGTGSIPAAVFQHFGGGIARVSMSNVADVDLASWTVRVSVGFDATWPDGTIAQGLLRINRD